MSVIKLNCPPELFDGILKDVQVENPSEPQNPEGLNSVDTPIQGESDISIIKNSKKRKYIEKEENQEGEEGEGDSDDEDDEREKKRRKEEREAKRRQKIMTITLYLKKFPDKLDQLSIKKGSLNKKSDDELDNIVNDIQWLLGCGNNQYFVQFIANGMIKGWEIFGMKSGYRIEGVSSFLEKDQAWRDLLLELEIQRFGLHSFPPEQRALAMVLDASMKLHQTRIALETLPVDDNRPIPEEALPLVNELLESS